MIAIDRFPNACAMARAGGAETLNFDEVDVLEACTR